MNNIILISEAEKQYIRRGCSREIRNDGRGSIDYRPISIENNILPHVNGSSRLSIGKKIDIICSVKLEVGEPYMSRPDEGTLEVFVDISPGCNLFNGDDKLIQSYSINISERLQNILITSGALDMKQFSIISGKYCWSIQIDILVLQCDGDPIEACSIATYIALNCTKKPNIELNIGESGEYEDFDVIGDLSTSDSIDCAEVPIIVSVVKVGSAFLIDATAEEQACASCAMSIATSPNNKDCCGAEFTQPGKLQNEEIITCFERAEAAAKAIFEQLEVYFNTINNETVMDTGSGQQRYPDVPPDRVGLLA